MTNVTSELGMFTRIVRVNRSQTPLQALKGMTHHEQYLDEAIVSGIPLGTEEEVTLYFFPIKKEMTCTKYADALESRGLKPDPIAQATFNNGAPNFADKHPNGTQWQNKSGVFCCAFWRGWGSGHGVYVVQCRDDWDGEWLACGVRK